MTIPKFVETKPSNLPDVEIVDGFETKPSTKTDRRIKKRSKKCCAVCTVLITLTVVSIVGVTLFTMAYLRDKLNGGYGWCGTVSNDFHASCGITWEMKGTCDKPRQMILSQIMKWQGLSTCKLSNTTTGNKCLYTLTYNETLNTLGASHVTPEGNQTDQMTFSFLPSERGPTTCTIWGYSYRESYYAMFDQGANYCNIYNLVMGTNIPKLSGFNTSVDASCTQWEESSCSANEFPIMIVD